MPDWTPEQRTAISETTGDLLVSASAGTGKTAVLVERIVRLVADADRPVDLDRLLVVTFTEAAAAEMREKIADALRQRLAERPADARLRRQLLLLDAAQISTIHAFCLMLIRRHFHRIGLDPELSVIDDQEATLLRAEVAQRLFERVFEQGDSPEFRRWIDSFGGADPAGTAQGQVLALHEFLRSMPEPEAWTERVRTHYPLDADGRGAPLDLEMHFWFDDWARDFLGELETAGRDFAEAAKRVSEKTEKYADWANEFLGVLRPAYRAAKDGHWAESLEAIRHFEIPRMPSLRNLSEADERVKALVASARDRFKERLQGDLAILSADQMRRAHAESAPTVHLLLDLAWQFHEAYDESKQRRATLDFADQEHYALRLLQDLSEDGRPTPSEVARMCHDLYEHVLVDEYQDTSPIQDRILALVSRRFALERPSNLFAVGDVKQSIYGFRLAAPEIFVDKLHRFPTADATNRDIAADPAPDASGRRVDLTHNFRSRACVVDGVNAVFERVMSAEAADVDYDEAAALVARAAYPDMPPGPAMPDVEVSILDLDSGARDAPDADDWADIEREAAIAARRIRQIVGADGAPPMRVLDRDAAEPAMRPAQYRDIVILLRSMRHRAETYVRVLADMGVPVYADMSAGYFAAQEVRDMLNLLRVIDNPRQDIPLAAVLRSPLFAWSNEELAGVRDTGRHGPFHDALLDLADSGDSALATKARTFLERIDAWRTLARRGPLADLMDALLNETQYPLTVLGFGAPAVRRANIERLRDLAARFDHFSRQGLGRFVRFIEKLRDQESDLGSASPLGEGENVVRIMTVHKSKGLEFPIVFVPDLGKRMNLSARSARMHLSWQGGMALRVADVDNMLQYDPPGARTLKRQARQRAVAEEMRVFYVALTRAREKLVLSGAVKKLDKALENWQARTWETVHGRERILPSDALGAGTWLDWLMPVLLRAGWQGTDAEIGVPCLTTDAARFRIHASAGEGIALLQSAATEDAATENEADAEQPTPDHEERADRLIERLARADFYPHAALASTPARISASEMRRRLSWESEEGERAAQAVARDDAFAFPDPGDADAGAPGIERGTVVHVVMRHLDLLEKLDYAGVSGQIDRMIDAAILTEEQRELVDIEAVAWFFDSPLGRRVLAAPPDRVWREMPFVIGAPPSLIGGEALAAYDDSERVRAQGVIDCLVGEPDGLVLIDFKTDAVPAQALERRAERYASQIRLYSYAVSAIFSKSLSEAWLSFVTPRRNLRMQLED